MRYVVVYAKPANNSDDVLVIKKDRPAWQSGMYNLPGGKIEDGEIPEHAAIRELIEECGVPPLVDGDGQPFAKVLGTIQGTWGIVYCVKIVVFRDVLAPRECETEIPQWLPWCELRNNEKLIPNLRCIVPMMVAGVNNWTVVDEGPSWESASHELSIHVQSHIRKTNE